MTIGKKLYTGFGSILLILSIVFAVNLSALIREHSVRKKAAVDTPERSSNRVRTLPDDGGAARSAQFLAERRSSASKRQPQTSRKAT